MHKYLCEQFLLDSVHQLRAKVARVQHDLMVKGDVVEHPQIYHSLSETNPISSDPKLAGVCISRAFTPNSDDDETVSKFTLIKAWSDS